MSQASATAQKSVKKELIAVTLRSTDEMSAVRSTASMRAIRH